MLLEFRVCGLGFRVKGSYILITRVSIMRALQGIFLLVSIPTHACSLQLRVS